MRIIMLLIAFVFSAVAGAGTVTVKNTTGEVQGVGILNGNKEQCSSGTHMAANTTATLSIMSKTECTVYTPAKKSNLQLYLNGRSCSEILNPNSNYIYEVISATNCKKIM